MACGPAEGGRLSLGMPWRPGEHVSPSSYALYPPFFFGKKQISPILEIEKLRSKVNIANKLYRWDSNPECGSLGCCQGDCLGLRLLGSPFLNIPSPCLPLWLFSLGSVSRSVSSFCPLNIWAPQSSVLGLPLCAQFSWRGGSHTLL